MSLPAVHLLALILAARGKWAEAAPLAARFSQEGSDDFHERAWIDTVGFFREAVRTGHAAEAVKLLDETNAGERWRPLREALHALAVGDPRVLLRVAPEVRQPAEELMRKLTAADNEPDAGIVAPAHALVAEATLRGASVVADAPTREWPGTARRAGKRKTRPASSRTAGQEPPAVRRLRR